MGMNTGRRRSIRAEAFSFAKQFKRQNNLFSRQRKRYLIAVVNGDFRRAGEIESRVLESLRRQGGETAKALDANGTASVVAMLRNGLSLASALRIQVMKNRLVEIIMSGNAHMPENPRFRKPEVLRLEREILENEYVAFGVAFAKAKEFGLAKQAVELRKQIEAKAKKIAKYNQIFKRIEAQ